MAFQLVSLRDRSVSRDWTQQELAEFYRVESVLGAAGLAVDMERGVSDEGDPWFIFCRPQNGDVIIHFARYDGVYIAASGALGQVLRGRNFRELVDAFIARQPLVMPGQTETSTVVLHPSALLTALVATALFLLDHQTADAAPVLIDVDLDRASAHDTAPTEPANKFAALINLLVEPLRPHEQREAMLTIGAIVAGIAALAFDAAKDSPTIAPAIELASDEQTSTAAQSDEDRLAQTAQLPTRKLADADTNTALQQQDANNDVGAGTATTVIADLTKAQIADLSDAIVTTRLAQAETTHKDSATIAFDGELTLLDLPLLTRPFMAHEGEGNRKAEATEVKVVTAQPAAGAPSSEAVVTVHVPAEKAELLQDSLAASLTKIIGAGSALHLSFVDASSVPQLASGELSKLIAAAGELKTLPITLANSVTPSTSQSDGAATDAVTFGNNTEAHTLPSAEKKAMEAISFFAQNNPDFKITQLGKDIILFDFEARPDNKIVYDVHSWSLPDGSKVTIIGALPESLTA